MAARWGRGGKPPPPPAPEWVGWIIGAAVLIGIAYFYASNPY